MSQQELLALIALLKVPGIGPVTARNLIAYAGGILEVYEQRLGELRKVPEIGPRKPLQEILKKTTFSAAEQELLQQQKLGARVLSFLDADYPEALKTIAQAPLLLFVRGTLDFNAQPALALVGTRKPTEYGREQARRFAAAYAQMGINLVSGLALGIDIEAHKAVLREGGRTTAVLAHGLDRVYPELHRKYAEQIVDAGGALVTEFWVGTAPDAVNFPARNRIISGLSSATLVIEAGDTGGAMVTARCAFEQNREVFALPGPVTSPSSAGCHRLVRENIAHLLTQPGDVLRELGIMQQTDTPKASAPPRQLPLMSAEELNLLNLLEPQGQELDRLAERSGQPVSQLMSTLLAMEFKGVVRQLPGRRFARVEP